MADNNNRDNNNNNNNNNDNNNRKSKRIGKRPTSTTSLGKRRAFKSNPAANPSAGQQQNSAGPSSSTMSYPRSADYGSQASPLRVPSKPSELVKVAVLGAAGGIGQPLALLLMLHSEYIQHLALYDVVNVHGVGADLSHIDRPCKVTTHLGPDELAEAVKGAKVIVIPAGLAQKPGMSRDDLFGSNSKIMLNLAKACALHAPQAWLAIICNPVNSLVPLTCEVYARLLAGGRLDRKSEGAPTAGAQDGPGATNQQQQLAASDHFRRIFGVTTLDLVRASTLTAKSAFFPKEASGLFKDPAKVQVPVVGGHAGKTIVPLLSQAQPKLNKKILLEDKATTMALIESIQQAGIEVLNAKKGTGSATLAMAYSACKFTINLLRAQQGEEKIIEYAYVRHKEPISKDLDYFSTPLLLAKDGYAKALPLGHKLAPFEEKMIEEASKELRTSIAKGEDFAREHLSADK